MKRTFCLILAALSLGIPVRAYEPITHAAISEVAARSHPESKVTDVLVNLLGYKQGLDESATIESKPAQKFFEWLRQGAIEEDDNWVLHLRSVRHFYNPITKEGLRDFPPNRYANSLEWAWNNEDRIFNDNHGWKHARKLYAETLMNFESGSAGEEARKSGLEYSGSPVSHARFATEEKDPPSRMREQTPDVWGHEVGVESNGNGEPKHGGDDPHAVAIDENQIEGVDGFSE